MKGIKIIEIKSEIGAGTRGSSLGIDALKAVGLNSELNLFHRYKSLEVKHVNDVLLEGTDHPNARFIDSIIAIEQHVCVAVQDTLLHNHIPIIITGDHSSAYGVIAGLKKAYPQKKLGVVWVDAHADLHSPYTTPSGNMHGMPIAMACNFDNLLHKINNPSSATLNYWEQIKHITGTPPTKVNPKDVVYISVRSIEPQEAHLIKEHGMGFVSVDDVHEKGPKKCALQAFDILKNCDMIYISFDVDSINSTFSKGTGTPVANGLTFEEAKVLNQELVKTPKLCAWEVTEINPLLDVENKMAKNVFEIIENVVDIVEDTHID